ncbi:hypothetical protein HYPSUDRAFT_209091 [Hypholoma sublateritium FD-334 SS-4]|uniref:Uncharacterized protein n=1 Tax=Hypholoma sublateritium (strain FD-334 SS-4) TaxID=945553 RepID=A0A0D2N436_HYPSF|nr:hypothetical protein HYPSUDRAFT_209091 [Hypholoma sublateritium FD-334 SS-4]
MAHFQHSEAGSPRASSVSVISTASGEYPEPLLAPQPIRFTHLEANTPSVSPSTSGPPSSIGSIAEYAYTSFQVPPSSMTQPIPQFDGFPPGLTNYQQQSDYLLHRLRLLEEYFNRCMLQIQSDSGDIRFYLRYKDPSFDHILWARAVLDQGMTVATEVLRDVVALSPTGQNLLKEDLSNASRIWRRYLLSQSRFPQGYILSPEELVEDNAHRLSIAMDLLRQHIGTSVDIVFSNGSSALRELLDNADAMRLLTERNSIIRNVGNRFAHTLPSYDKVREELCGPNSHLLTIDNGSTQTGISGILLFLQRMQPSPSPLHRPPRPPRPPHQPDNVVPSPSVPSSSIPSPVVPSPSMSSPPASAGVGTAASSSKMSWASVVAKQTTPASSLAPQPTRPGPSTSKSASPQATAPPSPAPRSLQAAAKASPAAKAAGSVHGHSSTNKTWRK